MRVGLSMSELGICLGFGSLGFGFIGLVLMGLAPLGWGEVWWWAGLRWIWDWVLWVNGFGF